jgi:hypothetical protein
MLLELDLCKKETAESRKSSVSFEVETSCKQTI